MLTVKMWVLLVMAIVAPGGAIALALARRRARKQVDRGGCIACGSTAVVRVANARQCRTCGYSGALDGGGALTDAEIRGAFPDGNGPDWV